MRKSRALLLYVLPAIQICENSTSMKPDKLEIPEIELSMRDAFEIYQRGGRITRSTRAPSTKQQEPRTRERTHSLLHYAGQPCFSSYMQHTGVSYKEVISSEYFVNKKLRRLSKQHLPQNCIFYEKSQPGPVLAYRLRFVKLNSKKPKANEYLFQENNRLTSRTLGTQSDEGILAVSQTLLFHLLLFEDFQALFDPILLELKKSYKNIKIEQLSHISEERAVSNPSIPQQNREMIENEVSQQPESNSLAHKEQGEESKSLRPSTQQALQSINKEIAELDKAIFKRLCLPGMHAILWPCVALQGLVGEKDDLQIMVCRQLDQASKDEYRSSKTEIKYDQKVLHCAFEEFLQEAGMEHATVERDKLPRLEEESIAKIRNILRELQESRQSKVAVHLLGTHQTRILKDRFVRWESLTGEQLQELVMKTPLRVMVDELNGYIECLNKFKRWENTSVDGKHSLFRLCKYENERGEEKLCIPLRSEQSQKRVLVRLLRQGSPRAHEEPLLQWIQQGRLLVNFTLPKHNEVEKKFYYIIGSNISIEEGVNYLYADYHYLPCQFNQVLRICYPLGDLRRVRIKEQRCISCYYQIHSLAYYRCKYCLRFCHQECTEFRSKSHSDAETSSVPLDIYETDNDDLLWNCGECAPCVECQMAVRDNFIRCMACKNVYHPICGRLKGLAEDAYSEEKYTCENCLKCRMCSVKLKSQEYCIEGNNIFCIWCYKKCTSEDYCENCMREAYGEWIQCDVMSCRKWVHMSCDPYFKEKKCKEQIDKLFYSCPSCRKLQRRKILRNVIEELKFFDEFQYFYEPDYEELIGYRQAIRNPICIHQMREKAVQGAYDTEPYQLIKADLELLVRNAMTFNMPKDEAHYRAKILLVVGTKYLSFFKDMIECSEEFLVNHNIEEIYLARKRQFYSDLYEHYLEYLLNFRSERGTVEVRRAHSAPADEEFFSSKIILAHTFANAEFTFRVPRKPHKIEHLFSVPRLSAASWWPVRTRNCYYHPDQPNPIVFQCSICWETYCCVKACFIHQTCSSCGVLGCGCDSFECLCAPMKEKEKKGLQAKIHSTLSQSKLEKREYTEYYKYCLKCVNENLKTNWCYLCQGFCYYAYEKCAECGKVYHLSCEGKNRWEEMSVFFDSREAYRQSYHNVRLPRMCYCCSYSSKHGRSVRERLVAEAKATASRIAAISKYLPIFNYIYELNGIRLAPHEITNLIAQNYQDFALKERYFQEFLANFSVVIENMGNNRIAREEFREYFMNEITRKLAGQNQHEKIISIVETREIKELKQSKKFYKIYAKWFNGFYQPHNFRSAYEVKYHLEHLTSKVVHHSGLNIGFSQIYQFMITDHHHLFAANFREENHLNSRNFERLKIESITTHVSPKSKKNIYFTNRLEKQKLHLLFFTLYYNYKDSRANSLRDRPLELPTRRVTESAEFAAISKEYEKYFRFHADYENLADCIYKEESSRTLLSEERHFDYFNPFQENTGLVKYNKLSAYREHDNIYINNKSEMLYKYLSHFALKVFEENKVVLKKGNTAILAESKRCWRVLKKVRGNNLEIKLEKRDEQWILHLGESSAVVRSIDDIVKKLREVNPTITSFQDVVEFMGFGMADSTYYEPNHFTHLLQTLPLDSLNRKERKREVLKVYDRYEWQRQGNFVLHTTVDNVPTKYEYNVTKKDLFYLKKRGQSEEMLAEPKVIPFITFEDIKKDLDEPTNVQREKEHFINKEPTYDVYIAPSKIDRLGLFLRGAAKKNTVVAEYIGEVISEAMADVREQKFHFGCYMFSLGKNNTRLEIIDATFIGNMARYLNHSCDPNCKAKIQSGSSHPRILIYTIKDVKENQELTYDYQFKIDANERLTCKCKSKNCQGRLT